MTGAMRQRWLDRAACRSMPLEWFFDDFETGGRARTHARRRVINVCESCPVKSDCLDDALASEASGARFGFRAGLTAAGRDRLARNLGVRKTRRVAVCGTDPGYHAHRRRGEDACVSCKQAHTAAEKRRQQRHSTHRNGGDA